MSATTETIERVRYGDLLVGDLLLGRASGTTYRVVVAHKLDTGLIRLGTADGALTMDQINTDTPVRYYELEAWQQARVLVDDLTACDKCPGDGIYSWGGTVNGVPVHTGQCFRCGGKGKQTRADRMRNRNYDVYGIRL